MKAFSVPKVTLAVRTHLCSLYHLSTFNVFSLSVIGYLKSRSIICIYCDVVSGFCLVNNCFPANAGMELSLILALSSCPLPETK